MTTSPSDRSRAARLVPAWVRRTGRVALSPRARSDALYEWRRRWRGEPALETATVRRVLVICHGNICRSPFAGRLLAARSPDLEVRSAGLEAVEGRRAEDAARRTALAFDVDLADHLAHRMGSEDAAWADLILGMEGHHVAGVERAWAIGRGKTFSLGDFLERPPHRIDDPWGREDAFFEQTFDRIERAVDRLALQLGRGA